MAFNFDNRDSDSPLVEYLWRTHSDYAGSFISTAENHWEMVVTTIEGKTTITIRGPETAATEADFPAEAEFFGIVFKHGTYMPNFPAVHLLDRNDETLPPATGNKFWLHGATWEIPDFENADTFVARLVREELVVAEPVVPAVLNNQPLPMSTRTVQRRFRRATGLTYGTFAQIERARTAVNLLEKGLSIADAVYKAGYADQAHLTRSLKHFAGQTPGEILRISEGE